MIKYSASYINGDTNFVIQNLVVKHKPDHKKDPVICILKNLLQRGNPTTMSRFLDSNIQCKSGVSSEPMYFNSNERQEWFQTIKGDEETGYNPAFDFFYSDLSRDLEEFTYIFNLIIPECKILDITKDRSYQSSSFTNRQVDFYLPQAKMVIEIDGGPHKEEKNEKVDKGRDIYLQGFGIETIRIDTIDLKKKNERYYEKINQIKNRVEKYKEELEIYKPMYDYFEVATTIKAVAVMRWQLTILSMIEADILSIRDKVWKFEVLDHEKSNTLELAVEDIFLWFTHLYKLNKVSFEKPKVEISYVDQFGNNHSVKVDFSLRKRWTDENEFYQDVIYVRTDYFDEDYFRISVADPVNYNIIQEGENSDIPSLKFLLQNIFGHDDFQDGQLPIIINALSGRNTVGLLPTGGGKSLCYQVSVLLQPSISFVVVPIKSLMYDQVDNLVNQSINRIMYISGDQSATEKKSVQHKFANGRYLFVFISPERFQLQDFREYLAKVNKDYTIAQAVIDEVHCLSEWGHDFRVSYLHLCKTINKYCPTSKLLGLSATASINVLKDIMIEFDIDSSDVKTLLEYKRDELTFKVQLIEEPNTSKKYDYLYSILKTLNNKLDLLRKEERYTNPGLIFTLNVNGDKGCFELANKLTAKLKTNVPWYSGEIPKKLSLSSTDFLTYKSKVQSDFKNDEYPLMIATKAFGMGVDKKNIRYTVHYSLPGSLESLYQEAGRAGRDKKNAINFILFSRDKITDQEYNKLFQLNTSVEQINEIVKKVGRGRQGDILSNFFLWMQNNQGVNKETSITKRIFDHYAKPGADVSIACRELGLNFNETQKAIYRLSLLGVVKDWVINGFGIYGSFQVKFHNFNERTYRDSLLAYLKKYDPEFNLLSDNENYRKYTNIFRNEEMTELEKCLRVLIQWTYDNIFYNRRMSLKNLVEYCIQYQNDSQKFKEKIESYFKFTDSSYFIDHIAQHPDDYQKWFELFYDDKTNQIVSFKRLSEIRSALVRFLENYRYNTGLNFISGLTRLLDDEFNEIDGKERLLSAFNNIKNYPQEQKNEILEKTLKIGQVLNEKNRSYLSEILCSFYVEDLITIHTHLQDNYSLELALVNVNQKMKKVGERFYGKLG